jgi:NADP-dependent 3-hydroxy acid dehydrogenase YdfG
MKQVIQDAGIEFGSIGVLVCSAGFNRRASAIMKSEEEDKLKFANPLVWKEIMDVNYGSAISATSYALPFMVNQLNGPSIFYIGSRTIRLGNSPGQQAYVASKMAISGFAASVQHEVKNYGIRVICLNVGLVATELGTKVPKKGNFIPVKGSDQIQPEDIADMVSFTLNLPYNISPQTIDSCGMKEEFLDNQGKALKMAGL